jgi:hypothetical protein
MIRTFDGLHLAGTVVTPDGTPERAVVLVHDGGVTREEGGFFTRLATGLGAGLGKLALHRFGSIYADTARAKDAKKS